MYCPPKKYHPLDIWLDNNNNKNTSLYYLKHSKHIKTTKISFLPHHISRSLTFCYPFSFLYIPYIHINTFSILHLHTYMLCMYINTISSSILNGKMVTMVMVMMILLALVVLDGGRRLFRGVWEHHTSTCVLCGVNMMRREKTRTQILDSKGVDVAAGVGAGDARRKQEKKDNNYFMHIIKTKVS